jgi:outer membrane lipoprotein-sorting protein
LRKEKIEMVRRSFFTILTLILFGLFLTGCPKKVPMIIPEKLPYENPIVKILDAFSSADTLQAKASIRVDVIRNGEEMRFPTINGFVFYQKPDKLRILGYSPFPIGANLFDALYRNGEFFVLIVPQKKAYTGEVSEFENLMEEADVQVSFQKPDGSQIPNWIRIEIKKKETSGELRLKDIILNNPLQEDIFQWVVPEGIEVKPLSQLLKGKRTR